jgi:glutamine amidotransferase
MFRWVAYAGPEIYLEDLIFHQDHSIVRQSLAAMQSAWVTNGDGFGVAWYNQRTKLGYLIKPMMENECEEHNKKSSLGRTE